MKKLIMIGAILLAANFSFGQTLQKGNLVGLHVMTANLKANVTMDDFKAFFITKVISEYEKQFHPKGYLVKSVRGETKNSFGVVWIFESEDARNKYFTDDGTPTDLGRPGMEKVKAVEKELEKLGTYTTKYTDWVVE